MIMSKVLYPVLVSRKRRVLGLSAVPFPLGGFSLRIAGLAPRSRFIDGAILYRLARGEAGNSSSKALKGSSRARRFVSDDGKVVHLHERYADSASALAHLRTFAKKFRGRFLSMVDRTRFTVFGTPER